MRASKKLRNDELLVTSLGSTILRKHVDDIPLWRGDHVAVRQLVEDFACYLYLPRLAAPEVLVQAIRDGLELLTWRSDTFGFAEGYDEAAGRYRGLRGVAPSHAPGWIDLHRKPAVIRYEIPLRLRLQRLDCRVRQGSVELNRWIEGYAPWGL